MQITKVSVTARIGRSVEYQTAALEVGYEADLDESDDADAVIAELRDRALREAAGTTNKVVEKFEQLVKKG